MYCLVIVYWRMKHPVKERLGSALVKPYTTDGGRKGVEGGGENGTREERPLAAWQVSKLQVLRCFIVTILRHSSRPGLHMIRSCPFAYAVSTQSMGVGLQVTDS